jgi:ATP-dependent protease Clp ATPase subunit
LRSIIESRLLDVMFEAPGRKDLSRVVIDGEVISGNTRPHLYTSEDKLLEWTEGGSLHTAA